MKRIGIYLVFYGIICQGVHTAYFGHNLRPESDLELVLDLFFFGVIAAGVFFLRAKNQGQ